MDKNKYQTTTAPADAPQAGVTEKAIALEKVLEKIRKEYDANADYGTARKYAEALIETVLEKRRVVVSAKEIEKTFKEIADDVEDRGFDAFDYLQALRETLNEINADVEIVVVFNDLDESLNSVFAVIPRVRHDELVYMIDVVDKLIEMVDSEDYRWHKRPIGKEINIEDLMYLLSDYVTATSKRSNAPWIAYRLAKLLIPEVVEIYDEFGRLVKVEIMLDKTYTLENDYELWWP
ncbi:hypothetical protein [Thermofilum sp.]|uniref:hypothetical protein n=1 Tax=Thermofilum sp. TaxID=1961369 RepID=UPI0031787CA1